MHKAEKLLLRVIANCDGVHAILAEVKRQPWRYRHNRRLLKISRQMIAENKRLLAEVERMALEH